MRRINKAIFTVLVVSGVFFSCSKSFLTREPFDSIGADVAITDEGSMQNALTGAYSVLLSTSLFGRDLPVVGDLQADNTYVTVDNTGRYLNIYQYNIINTDGTYGEIFSTAYTGILRANQVIDASITGDNVPQLKAQAYALRALLYFELVNAYGRPYTADSSALGVPLILHYSPYDLPARNTVGEVYNQIVSDLNQAFQDAPDYTNSVTLSKYAIEGLLARVYLFMGDNKDAQAKSVDVIKNSGFKLVSRVNYLAFWNNSAIQSDKTEVMFEVNADQLNNNGFEDLGGIYNNGYDDIYASKQLVDLYDSSDIRLFVIKQGQNKGKDSAYIVNKFPNASNADDDNIKVLRLSEVYLTAAEASASLSDESDAKTYLNDLMAERDTALNYTSSGAQLLNDIITERRKELAFEGDRFYTLNRLKKDISREDNKGALPASLSIPYSDFRRIGPIPESEIQSNANIAKEQNPGY